MWAIYFHDFYSSLTFPDYGAEYYTINAWSWTFAISRWFGRGYVGECQAFIELEKVKMVSQLELTVPFVGLAIEYFFFCIDYIFAHSQTEKEKYGFITNSS